MPLTLSDLPQTLLVDVFEAAFDPMDQAALRATCTTALEAFAVTAVGDERRKLPAFLTTTASVGTDTVDCPLRVAPAACGSPRRVAGHPPATSAREGATGGGALSSQAMDPLAAMVRTNPHPASGLQRPVRRCEQLHIRVFDYGVFGQRAVHSRNNDPVLNAIPEPIMDALLFIAFRRLRIVVDDPSGESWAKVCVCFTGGHAGSVPDQCHEIVFAPPSSSSSGCLLAIAENSFARIPELRTIRFDHHHQEEGSNNGTGGGGQRWGLSELRNGCLSCLPRLDSIDFLCRDGGARSLSLIGRKVFSDLPALCDVRLDDMPQLAAIRGGVFANCAALRTLRVSGVPQLVTIGDHFADRCPALEHVELDLPNVTDIGEHFIASSPRIQRIAHPTSSTPNDDDDDADTLALWCPRLRDVSSMFLAASSLGKVVLQVAPGDEVRPLQSITTSAFAQGNTLREITLRHLPNLRIVDFMCNYTACPSAEFANLRRLTLADLPAVLSLATGFASQLPALEVAELLNLQSLVGIPAQSFACCPQLKEIVMTNLLSVTYVGAQFAYGCESLASIRLDFTSVPNVERIEDGFAASCASLTSIEIAGLWRLSTLGDDFARGCPRLESVSVQGADSNGTAIGASFAAQCPSLVRADVAGFGNAVVSIGDRFLFRCRALEAGGITLPRLASNEANPPVNPGDGKQPAPPARRTATIGKYCMAECSSLGLPDVELLRPFQGAAIGARAFARTVGTPSTPPVPGPVSNDAQLDELKSIFASVDAGFGFMSVA